MRKILFSMLAMAVLLVSCENSDWEFPNTDTTSVCFANQSPVRTITLGEDTYPTDLDNAHQCQIMPVWGGGYSPESNVTVTLSVDESLCDGLKFDDGTAVTPMPASYYSLSSNQAVIPAGKVIGGITVQLSDAFFADPLSLTTHYVIPVKITDVQGADTILESKNFTLYAITYKNKWHGTWLCSGTDVINDNGATSTEERTAEYVENYDLCTLTSTSLMQVSYPVSTIVKVKNAAGSLVNKEISANLLLTFDDSGNCTVSTDTEGCTATGSGRWTYHGSPKAWGDKDRDLIELNYTLTYSYQQSDADPVVYKKISTTESLIARDRGSKFETFTYSE